MGGDEITLKKLDIIQVMTEKIYPGALSAILLLISWGTSFAQVFDTGCDINGPTSVCINTPVNFTSNCHSGYFNVFEWYIDDDDDPVFTEHSTQPYPQVYHPSFTYTFTTAGTHVVKLGAHCQDENDCSRQHMQFELFTITVNSVATPTINASSAIQFCDAGNVSLSIASPVEGVTYQWRSVPSGFTATGTSVTFNNVTTTTQFFAKGTSGSCVGSEASFTVTIYKTTVTPTLDPVNYYHKAIINSGVASSHYWQSSSSGTDVTKPVTGNLEVFTPGDYFIRRYSSTASCWTTATGPVHADINTTPPLPAVIQVPKTGFNEIIFTDANKDQWFTYATFYWVKDATNDPEIIRPYNDGTTTIGNKVFSSGTYYLKGKDNGTGTWGPTLTLSVELSGDHGINWIYSKVFDGTYTQGKPTIAGETKSYFDQSGIALQSQTKNLTTGKILTSQSLRDRYDRVVGNTLTAPIKEDDFSYNSAFVLASDGNIYDHKSFDWTDPEDPNNNTVYNPVEVNDNAEGTVGWYYSENNSLESHVPTTKFPYTRTEFYNDGTGEAKRSASVGEVHRLGAGHEVLSGTFPVRNELNDYLDQRSIAIPDIAQDGSLRDEGVQTVTRDQNGKYTVSIADKSDRTVFSARAGTPSDYTLSVTNAVGAGAHSTVYFYILHSQAVNMYGSNFIVENIATNEQKVNGTFAGADGNWPAGFYRILCLNTNSSASVTYTNYYLDLSYQFYDDAGRVRSSISPNGTVKSSKVYERIIAGKQWGYGASTTLGAGRWLNIHLSWQTSDSESDIVYSKFVMPAGTYDISGRWARTVEGGTGSSSIAYYLLDKNLNVLDSKSAALSSNINETTLSLTSAQEIAYIGAKATISSTYSPTSVYSVYIEGNLLTGRTFQEYATLDKTDYEYNFQGWLLRMNEPDAGTTQYVYRKDGKIRFSQNAEQENNNRYSYTHYDEVGRPVESGEYTGTAAPFVPMDAANFSSSLMKEELEKKSHEIEWADADKLDWIKTNYDSPDPNFSSTTGVASLYSQDFVHGAVSWTENANIKTWYSYDELGRVTWMARKPKMLQQVFVVKYTYDFLGNVLMVANLSYTTTGTLLSQFYHHYEYDADKRLSKAYTSLEETGSKKLRATYTYYLHGPLKRIELGDALQGIDFVYNIQGWLTQINHPDPALDPGGDTNDAFGMVLDYYESDLANLLTSSAGSPHDPARRHGLPADLWAALTDHHPPLIRFAPEQPSSESALPLKTYSAENQRYKQMVMQTKNKQQ